MNPYPKYKATNISWLTEVPEDWKKSTGNIKET